MRWGFELLVFCVGALAVHDAWRSEVRWRAALAGAFVYALAFEWAVTTEAAGGFRYGEFAVHGPGGAPLWVPIGWACLVYAAMRTSERLALPPALAVALDAALVAAVGWLLDPAAVALGWWSWSEPGEPTIFGAPAANYLAWLLVGASYSAALRLLERRLSPWIAAGLAAPLALALVAGLGELSRLAGEATALLGLDALALVLAAVGLVRARAGREARWPIVAIPALTALGVATVVLASGATARAPHLWWTVPAFGSLATLPHLYRGRPPQPG